MGMLECTSWFLDRRVFFSLDAPSAGTEDSARVEGWLRDLVVRRPRNALGALLAIMMERGGREMIPTAVTVRIIAAVLREL